MTDSAAPEKFPTSAVDSLLSVEWVHSHNEGQQLASDWPYREQVMQLVVALVLFAIFWVVSPRISQWLFNLNFVLSVGGYTLLRIVALFFGATKGGGTTGMLEEEALVIGRSFFGMAAKYEH